MPDADEAPMDASGASSDGSTDDVVVRPTQFGDLLNILALIEPFVDEGILLPRTEGELVELLASSFVAEDQGRLVGYVSLEIYSIKLAEVRSLTVADGYQRRGLGKRLVQACVDLARRKNIIEVMAITSNEVFFKLCGFDFTLPGEKKALFIHTRDERHLPK